MTKDQYLLMCEQTGEEIDWDRCPPDADDFPESVLTSLEIFNQLGDRVYPDVGYIGKDFTNLDLLFNLYKVDYHRQKEWILELLLFMDTIAIEESQQRIKEQISKMKSKK